jgi:nucleoid DNA-binding protein/cell division septation protein DedD
MTRTELVKKIIRFAAVPEQEAKVFMETLLRRLSSILSYEDVFKIAGIGAFRVKDLHNEFNKTLSNSSSVIVFNDDYFFGDGGTELLFGIPESKKEKISEIDASFSISIGKPIIPLRVDDKADLYSLYSGSEINFIIDSKVEKLINNSEIIRNQFQFSESNNLSKDIENNSSTDESLLAPVLSKQIDLFNETDFSDEISWDFGQTWQDEFDENEILNVEESKEGIEITNLTSINDKDLDDIYSTWDFGGGKSKSFIDEEKSESHIEKAFLDNEIQAGILDQEVIPADEDTLLTQTQEFWQSIDDDQIVNKKPETNYEDSIYDDYKPVKSRTQELNIDISGIDLSEYDEPHKDYDSEDDAWKRLTNEIEDDSFVEVTKENNNFNIDDFYYNPERTAEEDEIAAILEAHKNEEKNSGDKFEIYSSPEKIEEEFKNDSPYEFKPTPYKNDEYASARELPHVYNNETAAVLESNVNEEPKTRKSNLRQFVNLIAIFGIICITGFLYYKFYGIPAWIGLNIEQTTTDVKYISNPVTIERDYEIPVNYPYLKQQVDEEFNNNEIKLPDVEITSEISGNSSIPQNETEINNIFSKQNPGNVLNQKSNTNRTELISENSKPKDVQVPIKEKIGSEKPKQSSTIEKKISENVFQDGNYYSVQVSSWKAKSKAQSEVAKFLKSGRQALLVEAQIPGRGIWYRVRITGFTSADEAEKFLLQNR